MPGGMGGYPPSSLGRRRALSCAPGLPPVSSSRSAAVAVALALAALARPYSFQLGNPMLLQQLPELSYRHISNLIVSDAQNGEGGLTKQGSLLFQEAFGTRNQPYPRNVHAKSLFPVGVEQHCI